MKIQHKIQANGTYICAELSGESAHDLVMRMRKAHSMPKTSKGALHVTLMYDEKTPLGIYPIPDFQECCAVVTGVVVLGESKNIAALELDCPELEDYHNQLKALGYKHSFETFLPHISVLKNFSKEDLANLRSVFESGNICTVELSNVKANTLEP